MFLVDFDGFQGISMGFLAFLAREARRSHVNHMENGHEVAMDHLS